MGGLVMKKAYIMAMQDASHSQLAERIKAMYFLATPHRGSGGAKTLKNILKVAHTRAYVSDMTECSGAIQEINDEFRHFSKRLQLCSLYETRYMKHFSSLIVDPQSAVLGYPDEQQIPMAADHRTICKFDATSDSNYTLLRNALASTVEKMMPVETRTPKCSQPDRLKELRKQLDVPGILDDDYLLACQNRMEGSCRWLLERPAFIRWKDSQDDRRILWIKGKPATGKSTLAGYVIDQLRTSETGCSYFFFKHGDKSKSRLAVCLRSLAFQMASLRPKAVEYLLELSSNGVKLDQIDEQVLWRRLADSGLFGDATDCHFWVIDALDECSNIATFLDEILPHTNNIGSLRILFISRDTAVLERSFAHMGAPGAEVLAMSPSDTAWDLRGLVESKLTKLGILEPELWPGLTDKILNKSKGSFLWTLLVLKELSDCHTSKEIDQTLEDIPRGMEPLYKRLLDTMSGSTPKKHFAKGILRWAACAVRPMHIEELHGALTLEFQDSVLNLEKSITSLCGQLVTLDNFGKVQMVHETAREYLLSPDCDSEFAVDKMAAHTHLAQICLKYLSGEEMKPPRSSRRHRSMKLSQQRNAFSKYAIPAFSYHVYKSDIASTETCQMLQKFLSLNIVSWIEAIADGSLLNQLMQANSHIGYFANQRATKISPIHPCVWEIAQWTEDLPRLSAQFSGALDTLPSAIRAQIPAFCPTESIIHKINKRGRRIAVLGASRAQWEDRFSYIEFRDGQPSCLRYGEELLAVGLTNGSVVLYHRSSYRVYMTLNHGEDVRHVAFNPDGQLIASCGMESVKVWDLGNGSVVHSFDILLQPLAMEFEKGRLLIASHRSTLISLAMGREGQSEMTERSWNVSLGEENEIPQHPPNALVISLSHGILAVAYPGREIMLWDLEEGEYIGSCGKKNPDGTTSTHSAAALALNPIPCNELMAVAYLDGDLVVIDPFADSEVCSSRAACQTLASCPSGRYLVAGCANGTIDVYEFFTLKLKYRVQSTNYVIKQIEFRIGWFTFADIRGSQCSIWEPACFNRFPLYDDSRTSAVVETVATEAKAKITTITVHPSSEVIFCGRDDGSIVVHNRKSAAQLQIIRIHEWSIRVTAWCSGRGGLLSIDISNKIVFCQFEMAPHEEWDREPVILFQRPELDFKDATVDVVVNDDIGLFIVTTRFQRWGPVIPTTREFAYLFDLEQGDYLNKAQLSSSATLGKWVQSPSCVSRVVRVTGNKAHVYQWSNLAEVQSIELSMGDGKVLKNAMLVFGLTEPHVLFELTSEERGTAGYESSIAMLNANVLGLDDGLSVAPNDATHRLQIAADDREHTIPVGSMKLDIAHAIGSTESGRLVFLDQASWVRSIDLKLCRDECRTGRDSSTERQDCDRHFFVPRDWFAGSKDIIAAMAHGDIMLTRGGELAVIKGGMEC